MIFPLTKNEIEFMSELKLVKEKIKSLPEDKLIYENPEQKIKKSTTKPGEASTNDFSPGVDTSQSTKLEETSR